MACGEGMFCRSRSILPRYPNSHLFPLCQFGRSHHVRMSKRGCWAICPPTVCKDRRHRVPPPPTWPATLPVLMPSQVAGEQNRRFSPRQPLWEAVVKPPRAKEAGHSRWLPKKNHPALGRKGWEVCCHPLGDAQGSCHGSPSNCPPCDRQQQSCPGRASAQHPAE